MPGVGTFCTPDESDFVSMAAVELPQPPGWKPGYHGSPILYKLNYVISISIEIPVGSWNGLPFLVCRLICTQHQADIERLLTALLSFKKGAGSTG